MGGLSDRPLCLQPLRRRLVFCGREQGAQRTSHGEGRANQEFVEERESSHATSTSLRSPSTRERRREFPPTRRNAPRGARLTYPG